MKTTPNILKGLLSDPHHHELHCNVTPEDLSGNENTGQFIEAEHAISAAKMLFDRPSRCSFLTLLHPDIDEIKGLKERLFTNFQSHIRWKLISTARMIGEGRRSELSTEQKEPVTADYILSVLEQMTADLLHEHYNALCDSMDSAQL